ncbi:CU044_5270 family protein [Streptosporangium subroseum]|uniref:CU044_5270 family protein n=1 Tax=Streptosporangium subroseum TaxID=106412 RepID=UPI003086ECEC|nr:CU044_5270 family protein [Streptosporangium subroseum]
MNDLDLIQDLRSEVRRSDPRALHAARERLLAAMVPEPSPHRSRRTVLSLAGVGALGLTLALGVTVTQNLDDTASRKVTAGAPAWVPVASVESLAQRAMAAAAKGTDVYPRADQWLYTKALIRTSYQGSTPGAGKPQIQELWQKGDGKKQARRPNVKDGGVAAIGNGVITTSVVTRDSGLPRWDVAYLRSLPVDPTALLNRLRKDSEDHPARSEARALFNQVQMILQQGAPPPRLRAALYTVVSKLEGIGVEENVRDLVGRQGMGIYFDNTDGTRHEIIVDPDDYAYLGGRSIFIGGGERTPHSPQGQYAEGHVIVAWTQTARGIVDRVGDLP